MSRNNYPIDYDNNWKDVSGGMIEDFIAFFLPEVFIDIDFSKPIDFLEQELHDIIQVADKDKIVDKLVRVSLKNGEDKLLFIHIEFQTSSEKDFTARMYHYYRLIRARYNEDVTSLVIYTGKRKPRIFDYYKEQNYTTSIVYRFKTYRVIKQNIQQLLQDPNPFAIVVLANYYVLKTDAKDVARLEFKENLYELARNRGYSDEKTAKLLAFIFGLMRLKPVLSEEFKNYISKSFKPSSDIMQYSQETIDIINVQTQTVFGTTVQATQEKLKKSVILLYTKIQMSIDEIAQELGETPKNVHDILVAAKVITE
jgi:hypothetical protein